MSRLVLSLFCFVFLLTSCGGRYAFEMSKNYSPPYNPGGVLFEEDEGFVSSYEVYKQRREALAFDANGGRAVRNGEGGKLKTGKRSADALSKSEVLSKLQEYGAVRVDKLERKGGMVNSEGVDLSKVKGARFIDVDLSARKGKVEGDASKDSKKRASVGESSSGSVEKFGSAGKESAVSSGRAKLSLADKDKKSAVTKQKPPAVQGPDASSPVGGAKDVGKSVSAKAKAGESGGSADGGPAKESPGSLSRTAEGKGGVGSKAVPGDHQGKGQDGVSAEVGKSVVAKGREESSGSGLSIMDGEGSVGTGASPGVVLDLDAPLLGRENQNAKERDAEKSVPAKPAKDGEFRGSSDGSGKESLGNESPLLEGGKGGVGSEAVTIPGFPGFDIPSLGHGDHDGNDVSAKAGGKSGVAPKAKKDEKGGDAKEPETSVKKKIGALPPYDDGDESKTRNFGEDAFLWGEYYDEEYSPEGDDYTIRYLD